ncbi:MAG: hypothetical protein HRU03_03380 [Nanoarchaeales archaeon]|nr:hypothetical protein [Nanoarchaeales archaeon]
MNFKNIFLNKSGEFATTAIITISLSLVIVAMMLFFASSLSIADEVTFNELAPELSYEFPKVVVYSYLNLPLDKEDSLEVFKDYKQYTITDLIWSDYDELEDMLDKYRDIYVDSELYAFKVSLTLYKSFSNQNLKKDDLIKIYYKSSALNNLDFEIKNNNFFFKVPKKNGEDILIYFKSETSYKGSNPGTGCKLARDC